MAHGRMAAKPPVSNKFDAVFGDGRLVDLRGARVARGGKAFIVLQGNIIE